MTPGVAELRPHVEAHRLRASCAVAGAVLLVVCAVPQVLDGIGHYEFVEALRFCLLAMAVPALLVVGAPWALLGVRAAVLEPVSAARRRHPKMTWSLACLAVDVGVIVAWRTPRLVNALAHSAVIVPFEAVTLVAAGIALWLELVESPPLVPRVSRPKRAVLAALAMWSVWGIAYLDAMSPAPWYTSFRHTAGSGLSAAADRQVAAAVMWAVAAATFMPVVFWNLSEWLRSESRGDEAVIGRLAEERRAAGPEGFATG